MTDDRPPRPDPLGVDPDDVPETLTEREAWVCWRYKFDTDRDEWTKVPVDADTGGFAKSTDPDTWVSFATALAYHERAGTDTDGVGFVVHDGDTVLGLDLDDCREPETGDLEAWAAELLEDVSTYAEVSPSGTGLRLFGLGFVPDGGNRGDVDAGAGHLEMYDSGRYLTVTGQRVDGSPDDIRQVNDEIGDVHAEYIAATEPLKPTGDGGITATQNDGTPRVDAPETGPRDAATDLSDDELLDRAMNAENGDKFRQLWNGDTSGYPSHSEARQALANLLAFWTGGDENRMLRLFRESDLYRDKDDLRTFENYEIPTALRGRTEFYDPDAASKESSRDGRATDSDLVEKFIDACEEYQIDSGRVARQSHNGETVVVGVSAIVPESSVGDAVLAFNRNADLLDGTDRQAVIGAVIVLDLRDRGEFFKTPASRLYYFHDPETRVYRVDDDGRRTLTEEFQGFVWERYNLLAGSFSRNLGTDIKSQARRHAPEKAVYRFAHYDTDAGELYITDFGNGYFAVTPDAVEWRANGTDVFFLSTDRTDPFEYLAAEDRPDLPAEIPGERPLWCGDGDALMRLFGNRVNYDEDAALGPADQRKQLYIHLHTLPFVDLLNARPIMAWVGEKGSGKTVLQRSIGRFIYGEGFTESVMPDSKDDFLAKVSNQALAFLDNYDDGVEWANDILAAVETGAGIDLRELYTTNDLHQEVPRCWLSLTSRDPPFRRDDVADRTLVFRVERVDDGFVGMGDYLRQVTAHRNLLWSAYLDNLQAIVRAYHEQDTGAMSSDHRMADWAIFARIVADALDVPAVDVLLETMETERATFALENEPWARVLGRWIENNPSAAAEFQSAGDLADALTTTADEHDLPLDVTRPQGVGAKLTTYREELGELYDLEIDDSGRRNRYRFATDDDGHDPTGLGRYV